MDWWFSDAHLKLRKQLDKLGEEILAPRAPEIDQTNSFPRENMRELSKLGLNSLMLPKKYGGLEMDNVAYAMACETMAKYCASTTMVYVMHIGAVQTVVLAGDEDQKKRFLVPVREEGKIGSLAFSEPATGGHFWFCVSQAERDGQDYNLSAEKSFVTSAGHADWYVVETRTPESKDPSDMTYLLVYNDQEGLSAGAWKALGMNGNASGPMSFRNVKVPKENRLGEEGAVRQWNDDVIDPVFLLGSSGCWLGIAAGALEYATGHAKKKTFKDFGKAVRDYQVIRHYLADSRIRLDAGRAMLYAVAQRMDEYTKQGKPHGELLFQLWELKTYAADSVIDITNKALQVTGGVGYKRGKVEQYYRDGRAGAVMGPTNEMCREWIGKTMVELPLEYWFEGGA